MTNPFVYGKEVSGKNFCNREQEIDELLSDLRNSQNVMLYSPRRFGKTSLIKRVIQTGEGEGIKNVFVDLYSVLEERDFISLFAAAVPTSFEGTIDHILKLAKSLFTKMVPQITLDNEGKPIFQFSFDPQKEMTFYLVDILDAIDQYSREENKKLAVVFDEFQQICAFKTDKIEKVLRTHIQRHKNIAYFFLGSQRHLLHDMFNNPNRPFYRSSKHLTLGPIPHDTFVEFIQKRFAETRKKISGILASEIVSYCEQQPYYVQYLANIVWEMTQKQVSQEIIKQAIEAMLSRESAAFENIWSLLTVRQRQALKAVALTMSDQSVYNGPFVQLPPSTMRLALKSLEDKDLIYREGARYVFTDLIFKKWVKRQFVGNRLVVGGVRELLVTKLELGNEKLSP